MPRPPAWTPPAAVQAAAGDGPRAVLKFRQDRAPAIGVTPFTWYVRCNKPALEFLLERARLDPTIAPRIPREAPAAGAFVSKDTLVRLLCDLGLFQADLDRLRAPAPASLGGLPPRWSGGCFAPPHPLLLWRSTACGPLFSLSCAQSGRIIGSPRPQAGRISLSVSGRGSRSGTPIRARTCRFQTELVSSAWISTRHLLPWRLSYTKGCHSVLMYVAL